MAWVITGTVNKTAVETELVGITETMHVVDGASVAEGAVGVTETGMGRAVTHTETETLGMEDTWARYPDVSRAPATATATFTFTGTATATDTSPEVTVSATVLPEYRAVRVSVNGLGGNTAQVFRGVAAQAQLVEPRLSVLVESSSTLSGVDYEAPMDVALTYRAVVNDVEYVAAPVVIQSHGLDWYCALGQPSLSRVVTVESFPSLVRPLARSEVRPYTARNPLVILHTRQGATGVLTLLTATYAEAEAMRFLLDSSPLFLFKTPADRGLPGGLLYLLAGDYEEQRVVVNATTADRRWPIQVIEVDRPPLVVPPPTENTWQDWIDEETGNSTWAAWTRKSWLDVLVEPMVGS